MDEDGWEEGCLPISSCVSLSYPCHADAQTYKAVLKSFSVPSGTSTSLDGIRYHTLHAQIHTVLPPMPPQNKKGVGKDCSSGSRLKFHLKP